MLLIEMVNVKEKDARTVFDTPKQAGTMNKTVGYM